MFARLGCLLVAALVVPSVSYAATGTIAPDSYAWSENLGWIAFAPESGEVRITETALTGYIWSEQVGWIALHPSDDTYVIHDGNGTLSGYAWGEGTGYIDFSGVTIDAEGYFHGYAHSDVTGDISVTCENTNTCATAEFGVRAHWGVAGTSQTGSGGSYVHRTLKKAASLTKRGVGAIRSMLVPPPATISDFCPAYLPANLAENLSNDSTQVSRLQEFLNSEGEFLLVNGTYDTFTTEAVKRFQIQYAERILTPSGLFAPTGNVYEHTRRTINDLACPVYKECAPFVSLRKGDVGPAVSRLQNFLARYGFFAHELPRGYFWTLTDLAVRAFQEQYVQLMVAGGTLPLWTQDPEGMQTAVCARSG